MSLEARPGAGDPGHAAHPGIGDPSTLLRAWELAAAVPEAARPAAILHAAGVTPDLDAALDLSLGACALRCARLLRELDGPLVDVVAGCPACGEILEAAVPLTFVDAATETGHGAGGAAERVTDWWVRPPCTRDLLAVAATAAGDSDGARALLLARCVEPAMAGADVWRATPEQLVLLDAAAARLAAAADPLTELTCPACGALTEVALDVGALLWERVAQAAQVLLGEIATLARSYGWTEPEVLSLGEHRRRAYLALAT